MRKLWADLAKARRALIESHAHDNDSFCTRFWCYHLFWLCNFIAIGTTIQAKGLLLAMQRRYCHLADRCFGGNRESELCDRLKREMRELQAKEAARHRRHEQFMAAIDQRKKELEEEMLALMHGNFVTRDPKTYN